MTEGARERLSDNQALVDEALAWLKAPSPRADSLRDMQRGAALVRRLADALFQSNARLEEAAEALGYASALTSHVEDFDTLELAQRQLSTVHDYVSKVHANLRNL